MKLVTRDTDYALRALCYIAKQKNKIVSVPELVKTLKVPRQFLRKLLQQLNKKKILISHKGSGGGFELAVPPKELYLLGIMRVFQGPMHLNECRLKKAACPRLSRCPLSKKINRIEKYVLRELKTVTVAYLLKQGEQNV